MKTHYCYFLVGCILLCWVSPSQAQQLDNTTNQVVLADEYDLPWPAWMFGHWVWEDESTQESAIALVDDYLAHDIPVSAIIIDSPWETGYNTFDWDTSLFPDPQAMIDYFHSKDVRVFMWITGVVNTNVQPLYDSAATNGYFMESSLPWQQGEPGIINWWKGEGSLIDWWNPEAVAWWKGLMDKTLDLGIDGWKVDGTDYNALLDLVLYSPGNGGTVSRNEYSEAYYRLFHDYTRERLGNDRVITARPIDNYGLGDLGGDVALFAPRDINFCGWVGDQDATFEGLVWAMNSMFHSDEAGFLAFGSDIGGYREDDTYPLARSKELFIRWAQFGTFSGVMENGGGGEHRPWIFDQETEDIYRQLVQTRYQLLPYLMENSETYYNESRSLMDFFNKTDYSFMFGPDLFVAPFFVEGTLIDITFPQGENWVYMYNNSLVYEGGTQATLTIPYSEYPVFIRQGTYPLGIDSEIVSKGNTFQVYPNPSEGIFTIHLDSSSVFTRIEIINALGQVVAQENNVFANKTMLNLVHLPKGLYIVRVFDGTTPIASSRISLL